MKKLFAGKRGLNDLLLIAGLLLLALVVSLVLNALREEGGAAVVRVDGVETARYSLSVNGRYPLNGGSNLLVIENGEAWIEEADCPDQLCVKMGKIRYTGQTVTCLPNKLTVRIEGGESDGVDFVVG